MKGSAITRSGSVADSWTRRLDRRRRSSVVVALMVVLLVAGCGVEGGLGAPRSAPPPGSPGWRPKGPSRPVDVPVGFRARAPRFVQGLIMVPGGDRVVAFEPSSGDQVWRSKEPCVGADWAALTAGFDPSAVVIECAGGMMGLDPATGEALWTDGRNHGPVDRTRVGPGVVMLASDEDGAHATVIDIRTGEQLWTQPNGGVSMAANDTQVFVASDEDLAAFDAKSGQRQWSKPYPSSGLYADDRGVYARGNDHRMRRLDAKDGHLRWEGEEIATRLDYSEIVGVSEHAIVTEGTGDLKPIEVFDIDDGHLIDEFDGLGRSVGVTPGGRLIALPTDTSMQILDDRTMRKLAAFPDPHNDDAAIDGDIVALLLDDTYPQLHIEAVP